MERTRTSIANMAADFLDSSVIGNINENFGVAEVYARNYDEAVQTVLAEFPWLSATTRTRLAEIDVPDVGLDMTAYAWPADCIAPVDINDRPCEDIRWQCETVAQVDQHGNVVSRRKVLYCDFSGPIYLRYKCLIEPRDMSPHLAKAVATELALRCEAPIRNSNALYEKLTMQYVDATKGSSRRRGGHQIDTSASRPQPAKSLPSPGTRARAGQGL
jgi:hypothetical protein